jgi:hypothetical protein
MDSHRKVLKMFSPLKILNSPFSKERDFWSFSSSLFFYALSLYWGWTRGILKCLRRKQFFLNFSFKCDGSGYTKIYEIGGVAVNFSVVDAYPGMDLCTPIKYFLGESSSKISWRKNHLEKIQKLMKNTSLNKAQREQELLCGIYLALVGMYMLLRSLSNSTPKNFIIEA